MKRLGFQLAYALVYWGTFLITYAQDFYRHSFKVAIQRGERDARWRFGEDAWRTPRPNNWRSRALRDWRDSNP